jgi:hypothetical protein
MEDGLQITSRGLHRVTLLATSAFIPKGSNAGLNALKSSYSGRPRREEFRLPPDIFNAVHLHHRNTSFPQGFPSHPPKACHFSKILQERPAAF